MTLGEIIVVGFVVVGLVLYVIDKYTAHKPRSYTQPDNKETTEAVATYDTTSNAWEIFHELLNNTKIGKIKWDYMYPATSRAWNKNRIYKARFNKVQVVVTESDIEFNGTSMCYAWDVPEFNKLRNACCDYCDKQDMATVEKKEQALMKKFKGSK